MTVLVVPAAGLSTRFGIGRPKFLLTHPLGGTMLEASLPNPSMIAQMKVSRILIPTLEKYFEGVSLKTLSYQILQKTGIDPEFFLFKNQTDSAVATVSKILHRIPESEHFFIKDCDNYLEFESHSFSEPNSVGFVDIRKKELNNCVNKAFISKSEGNHLIRIEEKKVIGNDVYVGIVKFESAELFAENAKLVCSEGESYISHVVQQCINSGNKFQTVEATDYEDWGTLEDWRRFCNGFATLFLDLDGVILENENPLSSSGGWSRINFIESNVASVLRKNQSGKYKIVFTTSRSLEFRDELEAALYARGFRNFELIMGLPHAKRILVNDFANTNNYPTALSVNLPRNANNLESYLH